MERSQNKGRKAKIVDRTVKNVDRAAKNVDRAAKNVDRAAKNVDRTAIPAPSDKTSTSGGHPRSAHPCSGGHPHPRQISTHASNIIIILMKSVSYV
ncbi:hypothetical protein [Lysinibacillus sp. NPDC093692]|uniref:hypothetical protein n=1 Tax=Lysinibacillus sp. NPDC093692 TaxID=3390578 RepID=UPI003D07DC25